jgi:GT2 family glycosyltransferase
MMPPVSRSDAPLAPLGLPLLGVVVVTFNSADVILDCLESLLAQHDVALRIVVVDNASQDGTLDLLYAWAVGDQAYQAPGDIPFDLTASPKPLTLHRSVPQTATQGHTITVIDTGVNGGFAAGVNHGLKALAQEAGIDRFWVLNPDGVVPPGTAAEFARFAAPEGGFALMGGRVLYLDPPDQIQIDGGTINRRTGVTGNINLGASHPAAPVPDPARIDFITGASVVASRAFYEAAGPMPEDYFLYYEEVDWAARRGALPLLYCPGAILYHRAGTAIGSPTLGRPASPFSLYFKHRARLRFMRRYFPASVPLALAYSLAKSAQLLIKGYPLEARTLLGASFGRPPSPQIRARLSDAAAKLAFGD